MSGSNEETVRGEVCERIGRELTDMTWNRVYDRAKNKLRHIVRLFGDADGTRNTVNYMAQLVIEAMRSEAVTAYTTTKNKETGTKAGPRGHTNILPQNHLASQEIFTYGRTHT